ncbi:hypothetical protein EON65_31695 [archaeon]|nr:MAG: hypothetical protein EON65_31695 [archaeon]
MSFNIVRDPNSLNGTPTYLTQQSDSTIGTIEFWFIGRDKMSFPTSFDSTNLVLGLDFDIDAAHLAIFSYSLRKHSPNAVVILFINFHVAYFPRIEKILTETGVVCMCVRPELLTPKVIRSFHPSSLRWILYDRLLNSVILNDNTIYINQDHIDDLYIHRITYNSSESTTLGRKKTFAKLFDKIIALDVRDSVFQSDPFLVIADLPPLSVSSKPPPYSYRNAFRHLLYVFAEDVTSSLGKCGWNSGWVKDCFGENTLGVVAHNYVICSEVCGCNACVCSLHVFAVARKKDTDQSKT